MEEECFSQRVLQWPSPCNLPFLRQKLLSQKESSSTKDSNFLQMQLSLDSPLENEAPQLEVPALQSLMERSKC